MRPPTIRWNCRKASEPSTFGSRTQMESIATLALLCMATRLLPWAIPTTASSRLWFAMKCLMSSTSAMVSSTSCWIC